MKALYYCKTPIKTTSIEPISRRKSNNKGFPVSVAANADGLEKLPWYPMPNYTALGGTLPSRTGYNKLAPKRAG